MQSGYGSYSFTIDMSDSTMKKYDPEDLEFLILHKQFNELYAEEKAFVLQHIESEEEYNELRTTLFILYDQSREGEMLEPDPSIRESLMAEFGSEKKGGFRVWLNSVYISDRPWHKQPVVRLALAACLTGLALIFFWPENRPADMAAKNESGESSGISAPAEVDSNLFAQQIPQADFPPAPKPLESVIEEISSSPVEDSPMENSTADNARDFNESIAPVSEEMKNLEKDNAAAPDIKTVPTTRAEAASGAAATQNTMAEEVFTSSPGSVSQTNNVSISSEQLTLYELDEIQFVPANPNARSMQSYKDLISLLYTAP